MTNPPRLHERFGVDLRFDGRDVAALTSMIQVEMQHARLVRVRNLPLDEKDQLALAASLGTVVGQRSKYRGALSPNVRYERGADRFSHRWHADQSWATTDSWTILSCIEVEADPEATLFLDTCAALPTISAELRERIAGRTVVHDLRNSRRIRPAAGAAVDPESSLERVLRRVWRLTKPQRSRFGSDWPLLVPEQSHRDGTEYPLVDSEPGSGSQHLRVGDHAWAISGLDRQRSDSLLQDIHAELEAPDNVFCQNWRLGDLIICDNRTVLHRRELSTGSNPQRVLRRVLVVPRS